jgi:anti-sigma B factor antagonist
MMRMQERQLGTVRVVEVGGTVRQEHAETLRATLAKLLDLGHRRIVLDLGDLTDFDSATLGTLMASQIRAGKVGAVLKIANPGKRLRDLLAVTRLSPIFDSYDSLDAAIASFDTEPRRHGGTEPPQGSSD